jgi:predicted DNA-binding ribbon-helix-helix protein
MVGPKKSQKSRILGRPITIGDHKTSISLEEDFWIALHEVSVAKGVRVSELVATINYGLEHTNLSSAIGLYILDYYRSHPAPGVRREIGSE